MKRSLIVSTAVLSGLAATTLTGPAAFAQSGQLSAALEEIVVTAERREASLQTVPVAVSALSRESLENRQVQQAADLERYVPSLKMRNNITQPTNLSPSLRGSTQQDASLVVAESPFGIYVDDVYLGRMNGNNVQLADIERVEVLRGPQGTLYGRNTLAGAIKFITRTPEGGGESWLNAEVGYGRYDRYLASVSAGGGVSDNVGMSIALQANGRHGFWNNIGTGEDIGDEENIAGRLKLHMTPSERFSATASISYTESDNDALQLVNATTPNVPGNQRYSSSDLVPSFGSFYTINRALTARAPAPIEDETRGETKQLIASLTLSYGLNDNTTIKSITGYVNTDDFFNTDFSGVGAIMAGTTAEADQFTQELQIQGTALDDRLNYIAGLFYMDESADQTFGWQFFTPTSISVIDAETESISAFGQADFALTDDFKVTAGIRYTEDKKDFDMTIDVLPTSIVPAGPQAPVSLTNKYTEWTPKFGIDYSVPTTGGAIDSMLLYASMARGFKSGGYNGIAIFNLNDARSAYGPEKNWTYEGGLKTDLADNRLRINAAYFYNRISDLTLNATVVDPVSAATSFPVQNAGDATIRGLEAEVVAVPAEGLNLYANMAFMSGKFRNVDPTSAPASAPVDFSLSPDDVKPPQVPDYTFTVGFDYGVDFALGNRDARFSLGADWYRTDDFVTAATNDFILDGYDRVNAFVALGLDNQWEIRLAMKNLTDEETISTGSRALGGFLALPPREYFLSLKYSM